MSNALLTRPNNSIGIFNGLNTETDSASPNSIVNILPGKCADSTESQIIQVTTTIPVNIATTGVNGLDTGSEAINTYYYIWIIEKSSDGDVKGLLSTSMTSPTMPTGYDLKRLVGAVRNNSSSNFVHFRTTGEGRDKIYGYVTDQLLLSGGNSLSRALISTDSIVPNMPYGYPTINLNIYVANSGVSVFHADETLSIFYGETPQGSFFYALRLTSLGQFGYQVYVGSANADFWLVSFNMSL